MKIALFYGSESLYSWRPDSRGAGYRALKGIRYLFESLQHPDVKEHVAHAPDPVKASGAARQFYARLDALNVSAATMVLAVNFSEEQSLQVTQDVLFADSKGKTMTAQELLRLGEMFEGKLLQNHRIQLGFITCHLHGAIRVKVRL